MTAETETLDVSDFVEPSPQNGGKWGADDEVGSLNSLTAAEVVRGVQHVKSGETFHLRIKMGNPGGDPVWPVRESIRRGNSVRTRNFGVSFTEIAGLEDLGAACAADKSWTLLNAAAPLKVVGDTGAPVNPVVIR